MMTGDELAAIAHDGRKVDLVAWATDDRERLQEFDMVATATTGALVRERRERRRDGPSRPLQAGDCDVEAVSVEVPPTIPSRRSASSYRAAA